MVLFEINKAIKFALTGGIIAFILLFFVISSVKDYHPSWGKNWFVRPILVTPIMASLGGLVVYLLNLKKVNSKVNSILLFIISIILYLFFLWIGTILGFDGTLWN